LSDKVTNENFTDFNSQPLTINV